MFKLYSTSYQATIIYKLWDEGRHLRLKRLHSRRNTSGTPVVSVTRGPSDSIPKWRIEGQSFCWEAWLLTNGHSRGLFEQFILPTATGVIVKLLRDCEL
jgi:hypothetical protein